MNRCSLFILLMLSGPLLWAARPAVEWGWPKGPGPFPIVILVTSEGGRNAFFDREIERWKERNYGVASVDLFRGTVPQNERDANRMRDQLTLANTEMMLNQVLAEKSRDPRGDSTKIGVVSWGVGATHVLRWLRDNDKVRAAALVSLTPLREKVELSKIRKKVLLSFAVTNSSQVAVSRNDFRQLLQESKVDFDWKEYKASAPLFMDFTDQKNFALQAAEQLRGDIFYFFDRYVALRAYK